MTRFGYRVDLIRERQFSSLLPIIILLVYYYKYTEYIYMYPDALPIEGIYTIRQTALELERIHWYEIWCHPMDSINNLFFLQSTWDWCSGPSFLKARFRFQQIANTKPKAYKFIERFIRWAIMIGCKLKIFVIIVGTFEYQSKQGKVLPQSSSEISSLSSSSSITNRSKLPCQ